MCTHRHTVQSHFNGYIGMLRFYLRSKTLLVVLLSMASWDKKKSDLIFLAC